MYQKLFEKIFALIKEIETAGEVPSVVPIEATNPNIFPLISVSESDTIEDETAFDTTSNTAVYNYRVRVVHQHTPENIAETAETVRRLVDKVLEKIRKNTDWGDVCVGNVTTNVRWGWMLEENRRVADIGVNIRVLLDVI